MHQLSLTLPNLTVVNKPQHLPYARPLTEILADLAPLPQRFLATRKQGKTELTYIPWHHVNRLLDYFAPGWSGEVTKIVTKYAIAYSLPVN